MKIVVSFLVVGAISGLMIYASGGFSAFVENLLSTRNLFSSAEEIDLDSREKNTAKIKDSLAMNTKKSSGKQDTALLKRCNTATSSAAETGNVLLNEVAWMGSGEDSKREWIELKNSSSSAISLTGWELLDKSGKIDVHFDKDDLIPSHGFHVVSRGSDFTGTINNSDEALYLFDANCRLQDMVAANSKWPAGNTKQWMTAERNPDLSWHTSQSVGGTPGRENSAAVNTLNKNAHDIATDASESVPSAIRISEVMAGAKNDSDFEFVELYNPSDASILLTGLSLKKRSSSGTESTLVSESRLNGKMLPAHSYLLLANEKGYVGSVDADAVWPSSYSLSGNNNGIVIYGMQHTVIDSISWDSIPDDSSIIRDRWESGLFHLTSSPTPQHTGVR